MVGECFDPAEMNTVLCIWLSAFLQPATDAATAQTPQGLAIHNNVFEAELTKCIAQLVYACTSDSAKRTTIQCLNILPENMPESLTG